MQPEMKKNALLREIIIIAVLEVFLYLCLIKLMGNNAIALLLSSLIVSITGGYLIREKTDSKEYPFIIPPVVVFFSMVILHAKVFIEFFLLDDLVVVEATTVPELVHMQPILLKIMASAGVIISIATFSFPLAFLGSWLGVKIYQQSELEDDKHSRINN